MHVFMHRGHRGHAKDARDEEQTSHHAHDPAQRSSIDGSRS
jgi:hypothetical protein